MVPGLGYNRITPPSGFHHRRGTVLKAGWIESGFNQYFRIFLLTVSYFVP
jgi:hypothetical protein